ncbi:MAG: FHA domain-containing protein [Candidatus Aureabacteria bacterium]|nr:FHA domain-containing protein [Candidatus Auribacterota bacterium]
MSQPFAGKISVKNGLPEKPVFHIKSHFTIGRDINNTFTISKNSVSRHHARIEWKEKEQSFYIFDEGSENGVVVNGRMILGNQKLENGDTFFISDVEMLFEQIPFSKDLVFEEDTKEVPEEGLGDELTGTHFMDIAEINPDYFEELREQKPRPEWIWEEGPAEDKPKDKEE